MPVDKLTVQQFAQRIKQKYPEYKDIDDSTLTQKIINKYPEYKEHVILEQPKQQTRSEQLSQGLMSGNPVTEFTSRLPKEEVSANNLISGNAPKQKTKQPAYVAPVKTEDNLPDIKEALDNAANDYAKNFKVDKENAKTKVLDAYKKGDLVPSKNKEGESVMKRGAGFLESFKNALSAADQRHNEEAFLTQMPKQDVINYLNNPKVHFNSEIETAPKGGWGEFGEFLGENASGLAKGVTGAVGGAALAPETGGASFGTFLSTVNDMAQGGYANTLKKTYLTLKQQDPNISDDEAYEKAKKAAYAGEVAGITSGAVLAKTAVPKPTIPISGVLNGLATSAKHMVTSFPKSAAAMGGSQLASDIASISQGANVSGEEVGANLKHALGSAAVMHFGLGALTEIVRIPSYLKPQVENAVASAPREQVLDYAKEIEDRGGLPKGSTEKIANKLSEFDEYKAKVEKLPISEEKKAAITGKLIQRQRLLDENEELSKYGGSFNDKRVENEGKIKDLEQDINGIQTSKNPLEYEKDNITGQKALGEPENISKPIELLNPTETDRLQELLDKRSPKIENGRVVKAGESLNDAEQKEFDNLIDKVNNYGKEVEGTKTKLEPLTDEENSRLEELTNKQNPVFENGKKVKEGTALSDAEQAEYDNLLNKRQDFEGYAKDEHTGLKYQEHEPTESGVDEQTGLLFEHEPKIKTQKNETENVNENSNEGVRENIKGQEGRQEIRGGNEEGQGVGQEGSKTINEQEKIKENAVQEQSPREILQREQGEVGETRSERSGMESSKQGQEATGESTKSEKEKVGRTAMERAKDMGDLPIELEDADIQRLTHEDTRQLHEELGLEQIAKTEGKSIPEMEAESYKILRNWKDKIYDVANKVLEGKYKLSPEEHIAITKAVGALRKRSNDIDPRTPEFDAMMDNIDLLTRAAQKARAEQFGRFGVATQVGVLKEATLADFIQRKKEALQVATLTIKQKEKVAKDFETLTKINKEQAERIKELEELRQNDEAQKAIEKVKPKEKSKKTHTDFVEERKKITQSIKDKLKKARSGESGLTAVPIPYAKELIAIAPDVAKMVKSLVEEGIYKLDEVISKIHSDLKDEIKDITKEDVRDLVAGVYNKKNITKSQATKQLEDLRIEAQLINKLEKILKGEEPKSEKSKVKRNQEIEDLRKQIKSLNQEKAANERDASAGEKSLENAKKQNEKKTQMLKERIAEGKFEPEPKKVSVLQDKELQKKYPEKFKAAQEARDKYLDTRDEYEAGLVEDLYSKRTLGQKAKTVTGKIANSFHALKASFDVSMPYRQGLWGLTSELLSSPIEMKDGKLTFLRRQKQLASEFGKMYKALASEKVTKRIMDEIHSSDRYDLAQESGLKLEEPTSKAAEKRNELYGQSYVEQVPFIGKPIKINDNVQIGGGIKASERAASTFINTMKWNRFNEFVDMFEKQGKTFENSPDAYKEAAKYVNQTVGRGHLGPKLEGNFLASKLFFSLRLQASRLQLMTKFLNPNFYHKVPKEVRVEYFKDALKFVAMGASILAAAKAAGLKVGTNPYQSDYGKIRAGNTTYDVWGGFAQYAVLLSRMIGAHATSGNKVVPLSLSPEKKKKTYGEVLTRFARSKASPESGVVWDLMTGKTFSGEPVTLGSEAKSLLVPMIGSDVKDAYKDGGVKNAIATAVLSAHGLGVNTYTQDKQEKKANR